tara:strand:- start:245 stop:451 length:207 start_codon:yes stop_codon:yes gene_type:complete
LGTAKILESKPGKGKCEKEIINNKKEVIIPKIIVVPILKNVDETIVGIIIKIEKGFKIPPVRYKRELS